MWLNKYDTGVVMSIAIMRNRFLPTVGALSVVGLVLSGCGDDSVSKADFLESAGKICKGVDAKLIALDKSIGETGDAGPTPDQQQKIVKGAAKIFKDAATELSKLDLPKEGKETVSSFIKEMHKGADEVVAAGATPEKSAALLQSGKDPMQRANALADKYGLTECGGQ